MKSEKTSETKCKFCHEEIQWGKDTDGKWIPLKKNLMGIHQCMGSSLPPFEFSQNEKDEE